jgi:hypothetical protein
VPGALVVGAGCRVGRFAVLRARAVVGVGGRVGRFAVLRAWPEERFAAAPARRAAFLRVAERPALAARVWLAREEGLRRTCAEASASVRAGISRISKSSILCSSFLIDAASFAV